MNDRPHPAAELLADIEHHQAMAAHHTNKVVSLLRQYRVYYPMEPNAQHGRNRKSLKSLIEWTDWLRINGPSLRQDVLYGAGVRLSDTASKEVLQWSDALIPMGEEYPDDTMFSVSSPSDGTRGAPPKIFFLWSQRWDIRPKFGVGPERPTSSLADGPSPATIARMTQIDPGERYVPATGGIISINAPDPAVSAQKVVERLSAAQTVLGVIQPHEALEPWEDLKEPDDEPVRFATMAEWDEAWAGYFDTIAADESRPTDEYKTLLRATVPEGEEPNAAIAIAYRNAVQRKNS